MDQPFAIDEYTDSCSKKSVELSGHMEQFVRLRPELNLLQLWWQSFVVWWTNRLRWFG